MELGFGNRVGGSSLGYLIYFTIYSLQFTTMVIFRDFTFTFKIDSGRHIFNEKLKNYSVEKVIEN